MSLYNNSRSGPLVGPGAMTQYEGRPGRQRTTGYVRVSKAPDGFFVAGSSIKELCGLYGRVSSIPKRLAKLHKYQLAYKHDQENWYMALVEAPMDYKGNEAEWLFIDPDGRDRFSHIGDTIVPGSGKRWKFVHRSAPRPSHGNSSDESTTDEDVDEETDKGKNASSLVCRGEEDEEELPWQLIAILSYDMLNKLRRHYRYYEYECRTARNGNGLPEIENYRPGMSTEQSIPKELEESNACWDKAVEAEAARSAGRADRALTMYTAILADLPTEDKERREAWRDDEQTRLACWRKAFFHLRVAQCYRRVRSLPAAIKASRAALKIFPCYIDAHIELGIIHLDRGDGHYEEAIKSFERALKLDRSYKGIDEWLCRAHAHLRREKLAATISKWKSKLLALEDKDANRMRDWEEKEKQLKKARRKAEKRRVRLIEKKRVKWEKRLKERKEEKERKRKEKMELLRQNRTTIGMNQGDSDEDDLDTFVDALEVDSEFDDDDEESDSDFTVSSVSSNFDDLSSEDDNDEENEQVGKDHEQEDSVKTIETSTNSEEKKNDIDDVDDIDDIDDIDLTSANVTTKISGKVDKIDKKRFESTNHYVVLGVPADFTETELKKCYRKVSIKVHPDKNGGSTSAFQRVLDAYKTLGDSELRKLYDKGAAVKVKELECKIAKRKARKDRRMKLLMNHAERYNAYGGLYGGYGRNYDYGMEFSDDDSDDQDQKSEDEEEEARQPLAEEIERKYFPDRFLWEPFGDPHEDRKRRKQKKR
eukprot:g3320.t1